MKHSFITAYHPAANGLAERANRKILQVLRPIMNDRHENWEDWLPQIATSINTLVNDSTGKSPNYILYGVEKRLLYYFPSKPHHPFFTFDKYVQQQMHIFSKIHSEVRSKLKAIKAEMLSNTLKMAVPLEIKEGDSND